MDGFGVPVENTQFPVTVDAICNKRQVTIYFPAINFQIGQVAAANSYGVPPSNGFLFTAAGYLPECFHSQSLISPSCVAPAGDGYTPIGPLSPNDLPSTAPPSGYIVSVDNSGGILVQQAGVPANQIIPGGHSILPFSLSYLAGEPKNLVCENFIIDSTKINLTQLAGDSPFGVPAGDNIRDGHVNDAFDGVSAWAWTGNNKKNYTHNILNLYVVIAEENKDGKLCKGKPIQITNLPPNTIVWDTSIAINRNDKNNIVVSYGLIQYAIHQHRIRMV